MKKVTLLFWVCMILTGCTDRPNVNKSADSCAIRYIIAQWANAVKSKDVNQIVGFFTQDGVSMSDDIPISVGQKAIRNHTENWFSDTTIIFDSYSTAVDTVEISTLGEMAFNRGRDRYVKKTPDGPVEVIGKWINIWKKIDGRWLCVVEIWNSDKP